MISSRAELLVYLNKLGTSLTDQELALLDMIHPMAERAVKDLLESDLEYAQHIEYLPLGSPAPVANSLSTYDVTTGGRVISGWSTGRTDRLQLRHTPVWLTGMEVREDTSGYAGQGTTPFGSDTVLTLGSDYYLDLSESDSGGEYSESGVLLRVSGTWSNYPRSVKVTYYGGWTAAQFSSGRAMHIKQAVILTVAKNFWTAVAQAKSGGSGGVKSEAIGKYSASYEGAGAGPSLTGMAVVVPPEAAELLSRSVNLGRFL